MCYQSNLLCSQLHAVKGENLYVVAVFHDGGGWASRENNCIANAITCDVWHGRVVACSVMVTLDLRTAANAGVAATGEVQLAP